MALSIAGSQAFARSESDLTSELYRVVDSNKVLIAIIILIVIVILLVY